MELSDFSFFDYDKRPRKRKPDYTGIIVTLLVLLAIALIVGFGFKLTTVRAQEPVELKDMRIYEQYENETLDTCEKYIADRI